MLPVRDRAAYDAHLTSAVKYTVPSSSTSPRSLEFGPSFFELAAQLRGNVTVGLNRRYDNQKNTREAALEAKRMMWNLFAIELGNEPEREGPSLIFNLVLIS